MLLPRSASLNTVSATLPTSFFSNKGPIYLTGHINYKFTDIADTNAKLKHSTKATPEEKLWSAFPISGIIHTFKKIT